MSPTNVEICANCGRLILRSEQAYLVGGKIVCAECDKLLRSEQVPQPTPSPQPSLETKKGTKKDASLRNRILAAIGIVIIAVVLWKMFFPGPKYWVEETVNNRSLTLSVKVTGPSDNLRVILLSPVGTYTEGRIEKLVMMNMNGSATVNLSFSSLGLKGTPCSFDNTTKRGVYTLMIQKTKSEETVFRKTIELVGRNETVSMANPE